HQHQTLQQAREAVGEDRDLIVCRDQAYEIERSAELLHGDMLSGLQCAVARREEEQSRSTHEMALAGHRLNVLAATFLPIATIASIFGMQLPNGLEQSIGPWLFWIVLGLGGVSGL